MRRLNMIGYQRVFHLVCSTALTLSCVTSAFALPDLAIHAPTTQPQIIFRTFSSSSCEVVEGCAVPGTRRLLNFSTEIRNISYEDLNMGQPENRPDLFVWASCHGHYHFENFAHYRLLNSSGTEVVFGRKMAFCLEDTTRWRSDGNNANRRYRCSDTQGIQAGWADVYDASIPCQWLDITGLPGGNYILEMVLDPHNRIAEANENNNTARVNVTLPGGCVAPANDAFANAQLITGVAGSATGNNGCATKQTGEPNHAGDPGGHSVWYRWTAPYNGSVTINTVGSDFDTLLAVYTGTAVNALTLIAQNDDIVLYEVRQSRLTFNAISNTIYRIAVDGWHGEIGGIRLNVNPPGNDAFASCQTLTGAAGEVTGHNVGATKQSGEPAHAGNIGGHSVWYCWTAPSSGTWTFDTINSTFDTLLAVYTGGSVTSLTRIASDDDSGGNDRSLVAFNATSGTNYRIAVDGFSGATGTIRLRWATPTRLAIRRLPSRAMELTLTGSPGTYQIQASSNLVQWSTLTTFTSTTSTYRYTNTQTSLKSRFYRAAKP